MRMRLYQRVTGRQRFEVVGGGESKRRRGNQYSVPRPRAERYSGWVLKPVPTAGSAERQFRDVR